MSYEEDISMDSLWEAANTRNWTRLEDLLNRQDAFDVIATEDEDDDRDLLFCLCKYSAPLSILKSVYFIYEQLALQTNYRELLQWASNGGGSDSVFGFLLDVAPFAASDSYNRRGGEKQASILHRAIWCKRNPFVIRKILDHFPNLVHSQHPFNYGETPFQLCFRRWEDRLWEIRDMHQSNFKFVPHHDKSYRVVTKLKEILLLLLQAVFRSDNIGGKFYKERIKSNCHHIQHHKRREWLPLHKALQYENMPSIFVLLIVELMPRENMKQDMAGNLPLHIAVSKTNWESEVLIGCILQQHPSAATVSNNENKLPLTLYIENGKGGGHGGDNLKKLVQAAPDTISTPDSTTFLYPFMLALQCEKAPVTVANELLKMDPSLVKGAIPEKPENFEHL